jgi:hypothetical protein
MNTKILAKVGAAIGGAAIAAMLIACGGGNHATGNDPSVSSSVLGIASTSPTAAPTPTGLKPGTVTDGTWGVGSQVQPGTYVTVVPADATNCYWERDSAADGSMDSIIANDNVGAGQQTIVTIAATDKFFKTSGCGTWTRQNGQ